MKIQHYPMILVPVMKQKIVSLQYRGDIDNTIVGSGNGDATFDLYFHKDSKGRIDAFLLVPDGYFEYVKIKPRKVWQVITTNTHNVYMIPIEYIKGHKKLKEELNTAAHIKRETKHLFTHTKNGEKKLEYYITRTDKYSPYLYRIEKIIRY